MSKPEQVQWDKDFEKAFEEWFDKLVAASTPSQKYALLKMRKYLRLEYKNILTDMPGFQP